MHKIICGPISAATVIFTILIGNLFFIQYRGQGIPVGNTELRLGDFSFEPEMVVIPAGDFKMGSASGEPNEVPVHTVSLDYAFGLSKYEVTFDQYDFYADAIGQSLPDDQGWGRGNRPVVRVSWTEFQGYIQWLNEITGKKYRLPTEAEWEYAARAGTTTKYSWGSEIGVNNANCSGCGSEWDSNQTAPVGSFAPNPFGLYDMHGNVNEWVQDCYYINAYEAAPQDGSAREYDDCPLRVLRGGSWDYGPRALRSAFRNSAGPASHGDLGFIGGFGFKGDFGFRLAEDL